VPATRIRLLGGLELEVNGSRCEFPARKSEALLCVLALRPGVAFEREWLAALLWPEVPEAQARTSLRQALGHLRKHLPDGAIAGGTERLYLAPGGLWVDTAELERGLDLAPAERAPSAELWRGELLAGFPAIEAPFGDWLAEQRAALRERAASRLEESLAALSAAGSAEPALAVGRKLLEIEPTREAVHRALMRLHAEQGDRAAALRQYERCRELLERALGLTPSPETERLRSEIADGSRAAEVAAPASATRLVIAVLPFGAAASGEERQRAELLAAALTEDVTTELARFAGLSLVARGRSALIAARGTPSAEIRRETGARLVLSGNLRLIEGRLRVTAALVDTTTDLELWSERWELLADDFAGLLDRVARCVVGALALRIDEARLGEARKLPRERLETYGCWLRGLECLRRGTPDADAEAQGYFERALELSPRFARAYAGLSLCHFNDWSCQAWDRWDERQRLAFEAAARAVELDDGDHVTHTILSRIHVYRRNFDAGERHAERALALNANDANMAMHLALVFGQLGDAARANALADTALNLNPSPPDWYLACAAYARLMERRPAEALRFASAAPDCLVDTRAVLAAASSLTGDADSARAHAAAFLRNFREKIGPVAEAGGGEAVRWILHVNPQRDPRDAEYWLEGLRGAGLAP